MNVSNQNALYLHCEWIIHDSYDKIAAYECTFLPKNSRDMHSVSPDFAYIQRLEKAVQGSLSGFLARMPMEFSLRFDDKAQAFILRAKKAARPVPISDALFEFRDFPFPVLLSGRYDALPVSRQEYFAVRAWLTRLPGMVGKQKVVVRIEPPPRSFLITQDHNDPEHVLSDALDDAFQSQSGIRHQALDFAEIELTSDPLSPRSFAIPERQDSSGHAANQPIYSQGFRSSEQLFVEQAKQFAQKSVRFARFTPFAAYWPTYAVMSAAQSQWYFYWRGLVRGGEYPPTDLSYIFLYVYELINLVGVDSPLDAYQKLKSVWRAYRDTYPRLDRYLYPWACDLAFLHYLDVPRDDLDDVCAPTVNSMDLDRQLSVKFNQTPLSLDVALLSRASNYDMTKSRFYQSANKVCDEYIPKTIALVDAFLQKQQGGRIAEKFRPEPVHRERYLFQSALYAGEPRIMTIDAVPFSTHPPLRDFLSQVMRYAESKLRSIRGYRGKLRGITLDETFKRLIDGYLERELTEKPAPKPEITIDADKLAKAAADAEHIQRMLIVEQSTDEKADAVALEAKAEENYLSSASDLLMQLDIDECRIIEALIRNGFEMESDTLRSSVPDVFLEQAIDAINEKSLSVLGSLLIVSEQSIRLIDEDYREDLLSAWRRETQSQSTRPPIEADDGDEWNGLLCSLSAQETDLLCAIVNGADHIALQAIADKAGTMVELMTDHINELAMAFIGDLLIENGSILEEYEDTVKKAFNPEET